MTAPTPGAEHDDKIAEALKESDLWHEPLRVVAELRAQLAARGLCITPIAPTTGAGFADGLRKAAEIVCEWRGEPKLSLKIKAHLADAILTSIPSAPSPTPAREREVEVLLLKIESIAREMPRFVPGPGCSGTKHAFEIEAGVVWENDRLLRALDALRSRPDGDK